MKLPPFLNDVEIRIAPTPNDLGERALRGVLWQAEKSRFLLEVPGVARYLVEDGRRITIDPTGQNDEIEQFLTLTPLAALLYQRGLLALHAAAVAPPSPPDSGGEGGWGACPERSRRDEGGAIILAGDSASGKSTLLAALIQRGWTPLADDLTAIGLDEENKPVLYPVQHRIHLWQNAQEKLGWNKPQTLEDSETFRVLRPHTIYRLRVHNYDGFKLDPVPGAARFETIGDLTYHSHIADALLDRKAYFRLASSLTQFPIQTLTRPRGRWTAPELADHLTDHYRSLATAH